MVSPASNRQAANMIEQQKTFQYFEKGILDGNSPSKFVNRSISKV
jgi:hypothetical protein